MTETSSLSWRDHRWPVTAGLVALALDHATKWWAQASLSLMDPVLRARVPSRVIDIIPNCLDLRYAENTGAAFSLFDRHPGLLTIVALVIAGAIVWWYWTTPREHKVTRFALGLVLGGAVGNLIDRATRGYVVDFIHAFWRSYHWPTFNVADSAICVGIGLLIVWGIREQKPQ